MQITINIEESQLQEVMDQQLKALDSEYLGEVVSQAIGEYFRIDDYKNIEKLLFRDTGWSSREKELTPLVEKVISNANYSNLQDVVDVAINTLKKNYTQILICAVSDMITQNIVSSQSLSSRIQGIASEQVYSTLNTLNRNNG